MTTQEIYDEIVDEKNSFTELQLLQPNIDSSQKLLTDLSSPSKVANWRLFVWIIATGIKVLQDKFELHKKWIESKKETLKVGSTAWYVSQALQFQYGDSLIWNQSKKTYEYAQINESNRIVKVAAAQDGSSVLIKVASIDNDGNIIQLTNDELTSLTTYMNLRKFAGVHLIIVSRPADDLKIYYDIYYDPLVLNSDGSLISDPSIFPVHDTINSYIKSLPFNGRFNVTDLTDLLQSTQGVANPIFLSAQARFGALAFSQFNSYYETDSGYLAIDSATPLSSSINYIPMP